MRTSELAIIIARLESLCQGSRVDITQCFGRLEITWRSKYTNIRKDIPDHLMMQLDDIDKIYLNKAEIKLRWERLTADGMKQQGKIKS
jgi:hypothetical protein